MYKVIRIDRKDDWDTIYNIVAGDGKALELILNKIENQGFKLVSATPVWGANANFYNLLLILHKED